MFGITLRMCPKCRHFSLKQNTFSRLYVCDKCGFAVNSWNLHTYDPSVTPTTAPKPDPKPFYFGRTKTKKPTKEQLEALSNTIDTEQGVANEILE